MRHFVWIIIAFAASIPPMAVRAEGQPPDVSLTPQGAFTISGKITAVTSGADVIVSGKSVRLEGARAPKRWRICLRNGENVDIGSEVADGFARKVVGNEASMTVHPDENGRLVGQGTVNGQDLGEIAIINGFAVTKIGDYRYAPREREARNNRPGLWSCSSFPRTEGAPETAAVVPAPRPLPPPMDIGPPPSAKSQNGIEYLPPDAALPPQAGEPEDDFDLVLDDVGGFFESIFSGIDRTIRDVVGAPPPSEGR
jgi:endonuclease YncB( thermonuclease family)